MPVNWGGVTRADYDDAWVTWTSNSTVTFATGGVMTAGGGVICLLPLPDRDADGSGGYTGGTVVHGSVADPWNHWVDRTAYPPLPLPSLTDEQREARYAELQQAREALSADRESRRVREAAAHAERQAERDAARERAEQLLRMVLSPEEREHYDNTEEVIITGSDGYRYRIHDGSVSNVELVDAGDERLADLCAHPVLHDEQSRRLPYRDVHAAQVLALRADASGFHRKANIDWTDRGRRWLREPTVQPAPRSHTAHAAA